jgi:hypothetical protein
MIVNAIRTDRHGAVQREDEEQAAAAQGDSLFRDPAGTQREQYTLNEYVCAYICVNMYKSCMHTHNCTHRS